MKINIKKIADQVVFFPLADKAIEQSLQLRWFDSDYWDKQGQIIGESKGRYTTWFIQPDQTLSQNTWVLRHYYRGGMIAKLTKDSFFYTGLKNTRGYKEVELLQTMGELNLPVPKAVAARVVKKGLFYCADLLMEKIDGVDLVGKLKSASLSKEAWLNIGRVIAEFHHKGIYHADLNAHNILIDSSEKLWLIDFDRCEQRKVDTSWQQQNMTRLKRSFLKESQLYQGFNFNESCWESLLEGYKQAI